MNAPRDHRSSWISCHWKDLLSALILAVLFSGATYHGANLIPSVLLTDGALVDNVWFEADTSRVYTVMTDRLHTLQSRSSTHPLFALVSFPLALILKKILHISPVAAIRLLTAGVAFAWISAIFMLLRMLGCRRLDAILFTVLAGVSAAGIFFFVVPETFSFGSLTILIALCAVVFSQRHLLSSGCYVAVNILTMSMTITNWMVGMVATVINHSVRRTFQIVVYAFFAASILWSVQKMIFPAAKFFFDFNREAKFMLLEGSGGFFHVAKSFVYHTLIMPSIYVMDKFGHPDWPLMLTQISGAGSATVWGRWAVVIWTPLVALGLWALVTLKGNEKFRLALGLLLAGQLGMHTVYGDETFLYALHFIVFLIPLVALSSLTKLRPLVLALTAVLIPCVLFNNLAQFNQVLEFFKYHGNGRQQVRMHAHFRPDDPWPRNGGHVVFALPGTSEANKAYYEPGGSFSPSVGSFGVSIWVLDRNGSPLATSDDIPLKKIEQAFVPADQPIPAIASRTAFYEARWSSVRAGVWRLDLQKNQPEVTLALVVRSVGPAGGVVHTLQKTAQGLAVNNRWNLSVQGVSRIDFDNETEAGWQRRQTNAADWHGNRGWGVAKMTVDGNAAALIIEDRAFADDSRLIYSTSEPSLKLSLPDRVFIDSLKAQTAHLMMGLVDLETRPGDPVSYSQAWQQEAAYSVVALAKAGQLDVARQLSLFLAEHDFFSGFGTETDGPGLEIWALKEVADRLNDPQYLRQLWPHIERKAKLIESMATTKKTIHIMFKGEVLPKFNNETIDVMSQAALASDHGLINGRTRGQYPQFYINAVGYLGLSKAASWAKDMGDPKAQERWHQAAERLQNAWQAAYLASAENSTNAYTYASGLWPSNAAQSVREIFAKHLKRRWEKTRNIKDDFYYPPSKLDLAVGETHQWLVLGDLNRTWRSLRSLWSHQTSPGLYTWSESVEKDYTYNGWDRLRGWANVRQVTPHYGTAAQMLALQIDMLGYLDETGTEPEVVIAAGVPVPWLQSSMEVQGLSLPHRTIDWRWDEHTQTMTVTVHGQPVKVRLGPSFAQGTGLTVNTNP